MNTQVTILLLMSLILLPASVRADETTSVDLAPTQVVKKAVDRVLAILKNPKQSEEHKRTQVMAILDPLVDFPLMARLSLGKRTWKELTAKDRRSFTDLFVEDLKQSYFDKLALFTDENVEYDAPVRLKMKGSPKYSVLTHIISKGERIEVSYALSQKNAAAPTPASGKDGTPARKGGSGKTSSPRTASTSNSWRVFDIVIEGVSIRKSKGSDYRDFLKAHLFPELLAAMTKKLGANKEKRDEANKTKADKAKKTDGKKG